MNSQVVGLLSEARELAIETFDDFEGFAAALSDWKVEAVQLDRGSFHGTLAYRAAPSVVISEAQLGRRLQQRGDPPLGLRTVVVPADPGQQIRWRRHLVSGDQIMVFPAGSELDAVSLAGFHVYTISFSEQRVSEIADALHGRGYAELTAGCELLDCDPARVAVLRRLARRFVHDAPRPVGATGRELAIGTTGRDILEGLADAFVGDARHPPLPYRTRDTAVRRGLEWISAHPREPLSVVDVCRAAGVSIRTLEYAFRERFGLTPKAYMLARRLDGARSELSARDGHGSVTHAATRWGFTHMSQFTALYKRQFGEVPSETLRAATSAANPR